MTFIWFWMAKVVANVILWVAFFAAVAVAFFGYVVYLRFIDRRNCRRRKS